MKQKRDEKTREKQSEGSEERTGKLRLKETREEREGGV
jgi:hypothetical protein